MSFSDIMTVLACLTFALSSILYIRDIAQARVKPSIATFGVLSLVNISQLIALVEKDVWSVVPFSAIGFTQVFIVFIMAVRTKRFYFGIFDFIALVGALIGYVFWVVSHDAAYNIYIINLVMLVTFVPLIIKAFREPALETKLPWQTNLLASFLLILAVTNPAPYAWIVPVRQFTCTLLITIGLSTGKKKRKKAKRLRPA